MRLITLTTDFGTRDWFVGTMKGVVLGIHPPATVVDLTHEIPPGDIRAGAFALMTACRFFPKGTVHVAVVDPGVGSRRRAIAVQTANSCFVGPDNGVLSWALMREKIKTIRLLENREFFLEPVSHTFHGRDIFAPVAAHLSRGVAVSRLGRELKDFVRLPWPCATEPTKVGRVSPLRAAIAIRSLRVVPDGAHGTARPTLRFMGREPTVAGLGKEARLCVFPSAGRESPSRWAEGRDERGRCLSTESFRRSSQRNGTQRG
jgi:hypothetical protein